MKKQIEIFEAAGPSAFAGDARHLYDFVSLQESAPSHHAAVTHSPRCTRFTYGCMA
jgi:hypothetical protein